MINKWYQRVLSLALAIVAQVSYVAQGPLALMDVG